MPDILLNKLQRVQNTAARIITDTRKHEHITPVSKTLHWLLVKYRIPYKIALITYKCLTDRAPQYLKDLIIPYNPARYLRSMNNAQIEVPRVKSVTGTRSFSSAAANICNNLPLELRTMHLQNKSILTFKQKLKKHFFLLAF